MLLRGLVALAAAATTANALGGPRCITFDDTDSSHFKIAKNDGSGATPILTSSDDVAAIHVAASTWADDVQRVVGVRPSIHNDTLPSGSSKAILVGSLASKLMNNVNGTDAWKSDLQGKWESYATGVVDKPMQGVDEALVVLGSDKRGTIFGLYELSEQMGVSPWYDMADVPVRPQTCIWFQRNATCAHGEPTVKYRGIFLNDEQPALTSWAVKYYNLDKNGPTFLPEFYERVFELLLRLKANILWPAMWASMFDVDGLPNITASTFPKEPIAGPNQVLADNMGIVMGTSHQEPMARNTPEWNLVGNGVWNYTTNSEFLDAFWTYGAERAKGKDTMFTVGMRGNGDLPLPGANIPIVEGIVAAQQKILKSVLNETYDSTPKMWCMYKEVMGYYATGLEVPSDVTAMLADDNWSNIMAVPNDPTRRGALYLHFDYVGDPRDYKWINTVNLAKTWEQLNLAISFNMTELLIINVGDLKPLETPIDFALNLAYDAPRMPRNSIMNYLEAYASREFGPAHASDVAEIIMLYSKYNSMLKTELVNSTSYSLVNYAEAEGVVSRWKSLATKAWSIYDKLDAATQPAFYELVVAPTALSANLNELYVVAGKSNLHAGQYRSSANLWADEARRLFAMHHNLTERYHTMLDGRWQGMLSQPVLSYTYWQQPMRNTLPPISYVASLDYSHPTTWSVVRFTVENSQGAWPGDNVHNCAQGYSCPDPTMLPLDPYGSQSRWVDVSSGGPVDFTWTAQPNVTWLNVSQSSGSIAADGSTDTRVYIQVSDWSLVNGTAGTVNFTASDGSSTIITVPVNKTMAPPSDFKGHVEGDGYVVIEAQDFDRNSTASGYAFQQIDYYGKSLSGLEMYAPGDMVTSVNMTAGEGPSLAYDFWTSGDAMANGTVKITVQLGPTLNFQLGKQLMFGLDLDNNKTAIAPIPVAAPGSLPADWNGVVAQEARMVSMVMPLSNWNTPGKHTLTLWGMTGGLVFQRMWIDMGGITARGYSYLGPPASRRQ